MLHVHHFEDEGFNILDGEMTFYVGEQSIKAHPGSFLSGPKDVPHAFTVDSGPARLLFVLSPAGMEGLIREMGEPARSLSVPPQPEVPPDEAEMEQLAADYSQDEQVPGAFVLASKLRRRGVSACSMTTVRWGTA